MMVSFAWKRSDSNAWKELGGGARRAVRGS